jgi:hypothetical protein
VAMRAGGAFFLPHVRLGLAELPVGVVEQCSLMAVLLPPLQRPLAEARVHRRHGPELATVRREHPREAAEPGRREQMRMLTRDACVGWIISLLEASDPNAVRLSFAEADAFLTSFGDPTGTAARRADLIAELRERLPRTALADEVIDAIASGTGGG